MKERTQEQNDAVRFYYNMKRLNEEMQRYNDATSLMLNTQSKIKKLESDHVSKQNEAYGKWSQAGSVYEKHSQKALEAATEAYLQLIAE